MIGKAMKARYSNVRRRSARLRFGRESRLGSAFQAPPVTRGFQRPRVSTAMGANVLMDQCNVESGGMGRGASGQHGWRRSRIQIPIDLIFVSYMRIVAEGSSLRQGQRRRRIFYLPVIQPPKTLGETLINSKLDTVCSESLDAPWFLPRVSALRTRTVSSLVRHWLGALNSQAAGPCKSQPMPPYILS